jgi:hypothetical protein
MEFSGRYRDFPYTVANLSQFINSLSWPAAIVLSGVEHLFRRYRDTSYSPWFTSEFTFGEPCWLDNYTQTHARPHGSIESTFSCPMNPFAPPPHLSSPLSHWQPLTRVYVPFPWFCDFQEVRGLDSYMTQPFRFSFFHLVFHLHIEVSSLSFPGLIAPVNVPIVWICCHLFFYPPTEGHLVCSWTLSISEYIHCTHLCTIFFKRKDYI